MEQQVFDQSDLLIKLLSDWRSVAALVILIAAVTEARIRLQRLIDLHRPDVLLEDAKASGKHAADFLTAQQDITGVTKRLIDLEKKVREDIKDVHGKIDDHLKIGSGDR